MTKSNIDAGEVGRVVERVAKAICIASGKEWRTGLFYVSSGDNFEREAHPLDPLNNWWRVLSRAAIVAVLPLNEHERAALAGSLQICMDRSAEAIHVIGQPGIHDMDGGSADGVQEWELECANLCASVGDPPCWSIVKDCKPCLACETFVGELTDTKSVNAALNSALSPAVDERGVG